MPLTFTSFLNGLSQNVQNFPTIFSKTSEHIFCSTLIWLANTVFPSHSGHRHHHTPWHYIINYFNSWCGWCLALLSLSGKMEKPGGAFHGIYHHCKYKWWRTNGLTVSNTFSFVHTKLSIRLIHVHVLIYRILQ